MSSETFPLPMMDRWERSRVEVEGGMGVPVDEGESRNVIGRRCERQMESGLGAAGGKDDVSVILEEGLKGIADGMDGDGGPMLTLPKKRNRGSAPAGWVQFFGREVE